METTIRSKVIFSSIIPAIRIVTGDHDIFHGINANNYPNCAKISFLGYREITTISLISDEGKTLLATDVNFPYRKFTEYAQLIDGLPVLSFDGERPIFRMKATVDLALAHIELVDFDPFENSQS